MLRKLLKLTIAAIAVTIPTTLLADTTYDQAVAAMNSGNYDKAIRLFATAYKGPENKSKRTQISHYIKECKEKNARASQNKPKATTPATTASKTTASMTIAGSSAPTLTITEKNGDRTVTIANAACEPDVWNVPNWMAVVVESKTSMSIMWDPNKSPNSRTGTFYVSDGNKTVKVTVNQPRGTNTELAITGARFANTRGGAILTDFGNTLYADEMRFLTTEINYNGLDRDVTKPVNIKIFNPNGTLRETPYGRNGYSICQDFTFEKGWKNYDYLYGVGRSDCSTYDAGRYLVEIYIGDDLESTSEIYINAKGGNTSYLTIDGREYKEGYFIAEGETLKYEVRTDGQWTTMDVPTWCKVAKFGNRLEITANPNTSRSNRYGTMRVVSGNRTLNISLTQGGI